MLMSGEEVVFIARGSHAGEMRRSGLRLESPDGASVLDVAVADGPADAGVRDADAVVLAVKSHDTRRALDELRHVAPESTPVVCLQNGVDNERQALRRFANVYGVCVMCPTSHLVAGVVEAHSSPVTGILDVMTSSLVDRGGKCHPDGAPRAGRSASSNTSGPVTRWPAGSPTG